MRSNVSRGGGAASRALTAIFYAPEEGKSMEVELRFRVMNESPRLRLLMSGCGRKAIKRDKWPIFRLWL